MLMKFYMTPGSCSTGIHILLEELGLVFEAYLVNLLAGDQYKPDYLAINPRATIPTLVRKDGIPLCDFISIAWWLGRTHPKSGLMPATINDEARALEMMNHVIHGVHGQGFARIFTSEKFTLDDGDQQAVQAQGREMACKDFAIINNKLSEHLFVLDQFSIADCALFYVEFWADRIDIPLPENCAAHYRKMLKRPIVRQVLQEEGYASALRG